MNTPNRRRYRRLDTSERIVKAMRLTVVILMVMAVAILWSYAAACDMPGSCT